MTDQGRKRDADVPGAADLLRTSIEREHVKGVVDDYVALHRDTPDFRRQHYAGLVNRYYDLVTDFFEYGWGEAFHFAPRFKDETFRELIRRHENFLALRLGLGPGMQVLDVGCGVGGPMRNIARFSGCRITGINNNGYQVGRAEALNRAAGLASQCSLIHGDFMSIPLPDASVDAAYSIEATVHAPSWVGVFREIRRVLKPGAPFAIYEWCTTDKFNPADLEHRRLKHLIEQGTGLPDLRNAAGFVPALAEAGFQILDHRDLAHDGDIPWYEPLAPSSFSFAGFRSSATGRKLTNVVVKLLEFVRIAPPGAAAVGSFLDRGAAALVEAGRAGIFTPMYYAYVRNPGTDQTKPAQESQ